MFVNLIGEVPMTFCYNKSKVYYLFFYQFFDSRTFFRSDLYKIHALRQPFDIDFFDYGLHVLIGLK